MKQMKMYILIQAEAPLGLAMVAAAHASLAAYLKFQDDPDVKAWLAGPFRKVVCAVTAQQFEDAKAFPDRVVLTESAWEGREIAVAFKPRAEWPKGFQFYRLFKEPPKASLQYSKKTPSVADLQGRGEAYFWVRGGCFNRPLIVQASNGVRTVEGKPEPELNFTFGAHFPPNLWSSQLSEYAALRGLEWAGPIPEA
jgi:hypothetical protein